jgi:hypothetical protein
MLYDIEEHIRISKCIDVAEERAADSVQESLRDRWEHGRMMLAERGGKKKLPDGRMAELVKATGCGQSELKYRMQFAEQYSEEIGFANALANCTSWKQVIASLPKPSKPKPKPEPKTAKSRDPELLDAVREAVAGGEYKREDLANQFGVTNGIMDVAHSFVLGERNAPTVNWESIPATAKQKLEMAQRQIRRELEAEAQARVTAEIKRIFERTRNDYEQLKARTDRILDAHAGVFTKAEFAVIQACLHPDSRLSVSDEKLAEAFRVFRAAEDILVGEKEQPTKRISLPSLDELKKRRAAK